MDRDRQRAELYGDYSDSHRNSHSSTSSWSSDDPPHLPHPHHDLNFDAHRVGSSGNGPHDHRHHQYHQSHRAHSNLRYNQQHNFTSEQNDSVARCGADNNSGHFGRKRQFTHSGLSSDGIDGGIIVKLYVGGIPRTTTEEEIHSLFEEHGKIVEVIRLRDKRTGQLHECGFVKYATLEEADRAIGALHNKHTFPAGVVPIKVQYADGERERLRGLRSHDYCKLYVGCLNKQASKREIEEIFSAYGLVESVYIVLDEVKQSRGCGFIQFSQREMAVAAMNALNGTYTMMGCDQPLIVRFADPKKPRLGEPRDSCKFGGSRLQEHVRPAPYLSDLRAGHTLPDASLPPSPMTMASSSQSPGNGGKPQTVSRASVSELVVPSTADLLDCDWSEHTCPDGYKYYYNCATCESRWEKPEEYSLFEKRVKQPQPQQMQLSSHQQELDHKQVKGPASFLLSPTCV